MQLIFCFYLKALYFPIWCMILGLLESCASVIDVTIYIEVIFFCITHTIGASFSKYKQHNQGLTTFELVWQQFSLKLSRGGKIFMPGQAQKQGSLMLFCSAGNLGDDQVQTQLQILPFINLIYKVEQLEPLGRANLPCCDTQPIWFSGSYASLASQAKPRLKTYWFIESEL